MPLQDRKNLKNRFSKGNLPSESDFVDLIDSMVCVVDDGITKTSEDGLRLSPIGNSQKLMSFYKSIEDKNPAWSFNINSGDASLHINNPVGDSVVSLKTEGKVGINNNDPLYELDVNGIVGMAGRVGTFHTGKILGDGKWHPILTELNGCYLLEVVAGIGKKKTGKYGLIHAFALSTFGKSKNKIDIRQAYYGVRCNKIQLRWTGSTYNYNLEMRTRCNYDGDYHIRYYISSLWADQFMDNSLDL